jgi:hypothetical protein
MSTPSGDAHTHEGARLRFEGDAPVPIGDVLAVLEALDEAYAAYTGFAAVMWMTLNLSSRPEFAQAMVIRGSRRSRPYTHRELALYREMAQKDVREREVVPPGEQHLMLARVVLQPRGLWEFAGALEPLTRIRGFLSVRHERAEDDTHRTDAERGRLAAQAALAEIEAVERSTELPPTVFDRAADVLGLGEARDRARDGLVRLGDALNPPPGGRLGFSAVPELLS